MYSKVVRPGNPQGEETHASSHGTQPLAWVWRENYQRSPKVTGINVKSLPCVVNMRE